VPGLRLSRKIVPSPSVALGEDFFLTSKRRWRPPTASTLPLVLGRLSEKPSPSARVLALGEDVFTVKRYPEHSGKAFPSVALREGFPESN